MHRAQCNSVPQGAVLHLQRGRQGEPTCRPAVARHKPFPWQAVTTPRLPPHPRARAHTRAHSRWCNRPLLPAMPRPCTHHRLQGRARRACPCAPKRHTSASCTSTSGASRRRRGPRRPSPALSPSSPPAMPSAPSSEPRLAVRLWRGGLRGCDRLASRPAQTRVRAYSLAPRAPSTAGCRPCAARCPACSLAQAPMVDGAARFLLLQLLGLGVGTLTSTGTPPAHDTGWLHETRCALQGRPMRNEGAYLSHSRRYQCAVRRPLAGRRCHVRRPPPCAAPAPASAPQSAPTLACWAHTTTACWM